MEIILKNLRQLDDNRLTLVLLIVLVAIAAYVDYKEMRIPNKLNLMTAAYTVIMFVIIPCIKGEYASAGWHLLGGTIGFSIFLGVAMKTKFKMAGDIKFIGGFGISLGMAIIPFLGLAIVYNLVTNLTIIKLKKRKLDNVIPFAPFFFFSFLTLVYYLMLFV